MSFRSFYWLVVREAYCRILATALGGTHEEISRENVAARRPAALKKVSAYWITARPKARWYE